MEDIMKKLLIIPALIGTTLFAGINGTSSCSNAVAVELNQDITLSPSNDKTYNGNPQKYGYYSFTVAQDTEAVISFDTPDDSGTYMALYSNCSSSIASKWSASNTTGMIEKTLPAGTYQFYISKDGSTVKDIKVNIVASTVTPPTTGNQLSGTKVCTNATNIAVNQDITLSPSNDKTYNGNPQKYGYYSFSVDEDTQASISFDTPDDSGTYMALYGNCSSSIASKWSASNTTGMIEKTLPAGTYQLYISKDGSTVKDIKVNINL